MRNVADFHGPYSDGWLFVGAVRWACPGSGRNAIYWSGQRDSCNRTKRPGSGDFAAVVVSLKRRESQSRQTVRIAARDPSGAATIGHAEGPLAADPAVAGLALRPLRLARCRPG